MKSRRWLMIGLWVVAIAVAFALDHVVAQWMQATGLPTKIHRDGHHPLKWLKIAGEYWFAALMAGIAVAFWHRDRSRALAFVLLCGVATLTNGLLKWMVGRARPYRVLAGHETDTLAPFAFHPFFGGIHLHGVSNLCFPSGHAGLAFATAAGMAILFPRLRWVFYAIAGLTGAERIIENAHYLSDVVVAAALGVGAAHLLHELLFVRLVESGQRNDEPPQQFPLTAAHS